MKYTDKIVILEEGRILQQGTYEYVKNNAILQAIQIASLKDHMRQD
jgi:ABC-type branched-subunit amino acid transport system ATPase component